MAPKVIENEWTMNLDLRLTRVTRRLRNVIFDEKRTLNLTMY